jgi:phage terminase small subunit
VRDDPSQTAARRDIQVDEMNDTNIPTMRPRTIAKIKRDQAVRRLARRIAIECAWITPIDGPMVRAWAQLERLSMEAFERLKDDGIMRADGTAHPLLSEIVKLRRAQTQLGAQLGLGPRARGEVSSASRTIPLDIDLDRVETVSEIEPVNEEK